MLDVESRHFFPARPPIAILGVPFDNVTTSEAVAAIERMAESSRPHYAVTANVDFLVHAQRDLKLRRILAQAHLVLCDGTPVLWASRLLGSPLPERVAGSDLMPLLLRVAAEKKYRVFFLGASPESAELAVAQVQRALPSLIVAGHYSPPFAPLEKMDNDEIVRRIRAAQPHILFVAFGCPKAEKWMAAHYMDLGVPLMMGVGGTIDFLAGRFKRAPGWMQRAGMEWLYRLGQEPRRLWRRYARDFWVFGRKILTQWAMLAGGASFKESDMYEYAGGNLVVDLSGVKKIDSAGIGLLLVLRKKLREAGRRLILAAPGESVQSSLAWMGYEGDFIIANDLDGALRLLETSAPRRESRLVLS